MKMWIQRGRWGYFMGHPWLNPEKIGDRFGQE
jgi:hypothetical protein